MIKKLIRNITQILILTFINVYFGFVSLNAEEPASIYVHKSQRFFATNNDVPFFWMGDTGWLLFIKLNRDETEKYLEDRRQKGFNVIQVMVLHDISRSVNMYGDSALINNDISRPKTTSGNTFGTNRQYDYWDHVDFVIEKARQKGMYMALVPIWGSNVKRGKVTIEKAEKYTRWLVSRYKNAQNVIWLNGGDVKGCDSIEIWNKIGNTIKEVSANQLTTFHPFGRTQSSVWFHSEPWLDFNMFQSGHRRYNQDTVGLCYGEDNWKYVVSDYNKKPIKPTLDGEPSYEAIPQGLHDTTQPYWTDADIRRYAYWSVFAGACGFTYGHNAIMQFHKKTDAVIAYGVKEVWEAALNAPGAVQMQYLKNLMLSKPYFDRTPAQAIIVQNKNEKYDYIAATRGNNYAMAYTCNGSNIEINAKVLGFEKINAYWFSPRNGQYQLIGEFKNTENAIFDPPGSIANGNDWVLILEKN